MCLWLSVPLVGEFAYSIQIIDVKMTLKNMYKDDSALFIRKVIRIDVHRVNVICNFF